MHAGSTIAAIATPPSAGGVGILRVSGPRALEATRPLAPGLPAPIVPRHAYFTELRDRLGAILDAGLFLYFQAPQSFTGEDVVELHAHGSPRLLALLLEQVLLDGQVRLAEPGEFSRRAFVNGRMDLSQAEAVAALVAADSEAAVRAAAAQVTGALSSRLSALTQPLRALHADWEGALNFPDEADGADRDALARLTPLVFRAVTLAQEAEQGALVRRGAKVVLYGAANAGKSTLFNALVGAPRALVDEEPGTTRDVLEARLEWEGLGVTLVDTAGLREAPGRLEALGISRARQALREADLAVLLVPPRSPAAEVAAWEAEAQGVRLVHVYSKVDVAPAPAGALAVSALKSTGVGDGGGVERLRGALVRLLRESAAPEAVLLASERTLSALRRCAESLVRASTALEASTLEAAAGEVALALEALGEVTGENVPEALLDEIFRRFCVGK